MERGILTRLLSGLPVVRRRDHEEFVRLYGTWVPVGHFYSPYADVEEVERRAPAIFASPDTLPGIDLRVDEQLALLEQLAELGADLQFPAEPGPQHRYHFDNPSYAWGDGTVMHTMLRHIGPSRIVEIGSGHSSAMILDTVDGWLDTPDRQVDVCFVEPYPDLLHQLLRDGDRERVTIEPQPVQDVDLAVFDRLQAGDVLVIDSTHVVKAGSDVNHLFFRVLPRLAPGVWVHVHDIF